MNYCKICLNTDTRPGTKFTKEGLCPVCEYKKIEKDPDWKKRRNILDNIVKFGKENATNGYDCIIGVSGGKDSTRQAIFVRDVLKMHPLLVCLTYPPEQSTQRGVENLENLVELGFDIITVSPSPKIWKKLVRKGFFQYGNYLKACEMALFASVPRFAIAHQIPLIWWGENSAIQVGESSVMGENDYDGNNLRNMNTLGGGDISWMIDDEISEKDLLQFTYPDKEQIDKANIKITFLGYFWKDWSSIDNAMFSAMYGLDYRENKPWLTGDLYGITALDEDWVTFNQGIKYLKFGFGRIHDYVNEEIWDGLITREEGILLLQKYDGCFDTKYVINFCEYLEISLEDFWNVVDSYVNKELFEKTSMGIYKRKFLIGKGL